MSKLQSRSMSGTYSDCDCKTIRTEIFIEQTQTWNMSNKYCVPCDRIAIKEGRMRPWPKWC